MVWFQCEDCGENLKKPKLANHFRMCSAHKLSCIDCGHMFDQQSVQSHTQCITEAGKYGPKGQGNVAHSGQTKPDKLKKNSDVDINIGLSSRAPWFCSFLFGFESLASAIHTLLAKQTLLLHADGKKHRAKARAFHTSQKQSTQTEEATPNGEAGGNGQKVESIEANGSNNKVQENDLQKASHVRDNGGEKESQARKRKAEASDDGLSEKGQKKNDGDLTNGEVIQAEQSEVSNRKSKKKKYADETLSCKPQGKHQGPAMGAALDKTKWKTIVTSTLKSSDGVMKIKKLQKLVVKAIKESGVTEDEERLRDKLMHKINSSTRFAIENNHVRLVAKTDES